MCNKTRRDCYVYRLTYIFIGMGATAELHVGEEQKTTPQTHESNKIQLMIQVFVLATDRAYE